MGFFTYFHFGNTYQNRYKTLFIYFVILYVRNGAGIKLSKMRTIKFRAFDKVKEKMHDVVSIWNNPDGSIAHVVIALNEDYTEVDTLFGNYELIQFAGLVDINGKSLFEGDILSHHNSGLFEIKFTDYGFNLFKNDVKQDSIDTKYMEFVRNVHEIKETA